MALNLLKNLPSPEEYNKRKVALISGITGQDGSYLTELLLSKGYQVHGIIRRSSSFNTGRLHHLYEDQHERRLSSEVPPRSYAPLTSFPAIAGPGKFKLHYGDLSDSTNLVYIIAQVQPTEIYNLGAQSHVKVSFEMAEYTGDVDGLGTLRLLDAVRTCGLEKHVRFYQASTSELYGKVVETPQSETTPFYPPFTLRLRKALRVLDRRQLPKITRAAADISLGKQSCLYLGNIDAKRDWGHARDYVEGMWLMLQQPKPEDFVLATGETHPVREFVNLAFTAVGVELKWSGSGVDEQATDIKTGKVVVKVDAQYFRPAEVDLLLGTPAKAERMLGWKRKVDFPSLVKEMVEADLKASKSMVEDQN
ncbi:GDP-mannose 4,6-dehydratase [Mycena sanguinolenta]|uniref:GDP-mannose 4,6-dehydratase n=1 Tax=Mycena sanguinolenta TaxID=230812 RepID=A0A8H7DC68_9AGAR|nr:GDP-mannose 4,6-dehydratase [Mycena sanguinolenta]